MSLSYPDHWKEATWAKGPKYNKIKEIIDFINDLTSVNGVAIIPFGVFLSSVDVFTSANAVYSEGITATWLSAAFHLDRWRVVNGTTRYLKITNAKLIWYQSAAAYQLDRFRIKRHSSNWGSTVSVVDDTTDRGVAGGNNYSWTLSSNNILSATNEGFSVIVYHKTKAAQADFRIRALEITYEYV